MDTEFDTQIDSIEYLRGHLAAMAYVSPSDAHEVHILRLSNAFERAEIVHKLRYSLGALNLMREVQKLGDGYWFPTPLRIIPINDEKTIIVGPASTHELRRHFPCVLRAGYARVLALSDARDLPIQELDDWLGLQVQNSIAWTEAQIIEAHRSLRPTISPEKVQYFGVKTLLSNSGNITIPVWTDSPQSSMQSKGMFLCRERYRYFFGGVKGKTVVESPVPLDVVTRLCFGFAAVMGNPITVTIDPRNACSIIHIPGNLPRPEMRLVLALGVLDMSLPDKTYRVFDDTFVSLIAAKLEHLGCEVRKING